MDIEPDRIADAVRAADPGPRAERNIAGAIISICSWRRSKRGRRSKACLPFAPI
jgi:hypothetical protein